MRNSRTVQGRRNGRALALLAVLGVLAALPLLTGARARTNSINVVNSSNRSIIHIYLAPSGTDNWGSEQLGSTALSTGQSLVIADVACNQSQIKVIAEDADGCFLTGEVGCGGAVTWTITNDTAVDCGQ
jgi:hypothetical protein